MAKSLLSQNSEIKNSTNLLFKFQLFCILLFCILAQLLSAQASTEKRLPFRDLTESASLKGFIFPKYTISDTQILEGRDRITDKKLDKKESQHFINIVAKEIKTYTSKAKRSKKRKYRNRYFSLIKHYVCKINNYKKKELSVYIDNTEERNRFFVGNSCCKNYFISTDNNLTLSKYAIPAYFRLGSICLIFLYNSHYFYNNKKSKIQIYPDSVFLRPPPFLS